MSERIPALKPNHAETRGAAEKRRGRKLLWIVVFLFLLLAIFLFFRSNLSKITEINVSGTTLHATQDEIVQASGARLDDSFFTTDTKELEKKIGQLQTVEKVGVVKKFPGRLEITVQEYKEVALEMDGEGNMLIVLSNGLAVPLAKGEALPDMPILTGWKQGDANRASLCTTLGGMEAGLLSDLSQISPDPSNAYPDRIKLYTRSKFEVVTTVGRLAGKLGLLSEIVENREPGRVVLLEADTYMPYSAENE
ncbi:cell division protein FtsQ/DivIB [Cohnella fermenti]|uniref:FtsQ-type POTRA domain-containing protein n=1 Tax=Cohnella fermenti TaxID=2565925 RepID=A0A4S4BMU8_9BACL|nr:FtsQ-type POTRA domain-containing protein [Cohnella fermenti]THF75589.1 FtsQ-type POTRA domain-containing protein [Cohnella fermenti]